jgi:hypothetical protein
MSPPSFEHPRFGRFTQTGASPRAFRGHWDTLALHVDSPEAMTLLEALPASLARFIDEAKLCVAAELLSHGQPRWNELTSARLAASLTPVALGALHETGRLTLAFEEGWPVLSDVYAELTLEGIPTSVGYTERALVARTPAQETRCAVKHGAVTIRGSSVAQAEALRSSVERIAKDAAHFAATSLAPLWNASWRDVGEPEMTPEAMAAEFTLAEIDMSEKTGAYEVTLHDGGLFAEHLIVATYDGTQWVHAGIEG